MKANVTNLRKALVASADAHNVAFHWYKDEAHMSLKSESVPVQSDVRMICEAFYGTDEMVDVDFGYTIVYLDEVKFLPEVNEELLYMALPYGEKIEKPIACELYQVDTNKSGVKFIHIFAYTYESDVDWRLIEGTWMIESLDKFIEGFAEHGEDYTNEAWEQTKQYEKELSGEALVNAINHYFYGRSADGFLQYGEITMNTPDGCYIHKS